jgi:hypothetical protein
MPAACDDKRTSQRPDDNNSPNPNTQSKVFIPIQGSDIFQRSPRDKTRWPELPFYRTCLPFAFPTDAQQIRVFTDRICKSPSFHTTMRGSQLAMTLATSVLAVPTRSSSPFNVPIFRVQQQEQQSIKSGFAGGRTAGNDLEMYARSGNPTVNGIMIGLLSSFGSALLIVLIFIIVYFFRYTAGGRILLDRIGRPGEYDDEQAFLREEAEALEEMDDLQRTEYLRAKGRLLSGC